MKVKLGDKVKDPVTGITGIATCYVTYLQGCERIGIQQPAFKNKDGDMVVPDAYYVDDPQLEIINSAAVVKKTKSGGPSYFGSLNKP